MSQENTQAGSGTLRSLKGDRAFQRLRKGHTGGSRLLGIRWQPRRHGQVRVGIVVSSKVGNAVTRNRVRRRLREALRAMLRERPIDARAAGGADVLVITRPESATASYQELRSALGKALARAGLL